MALAEIIFGQVFDRVLDTVSKSSVPVAAGNEEAVAKAITKEIAPIVVNATNSEPWFQSRVTWGAIAAILSGLGTAASLLAAGDWSPELWLAALGSVGGGAGTLFGRWAAKKPIALPGGLKPCSSASSQV